METTGRRLLRYALSYKKHIIMALIFLALAVCAEMIGPFVAKSVIDNRILGIEKPWYQVAEKMPYSAEYEGNYYKREGRFQAGEEKGRQVRILQIGRTYYWIGEPVDRTDGKKEAADGAVTISEEWGRASYPAKALSREELYPFYKPEFPGLLMMTGSYFGLLVIGAAFTYGQRLFLQTAANRIVQKMREDVFSRLQRLPIGYFDNLPAGKVVSRITNDTEAVRELFVAVLANFFTGIVYIAAVLGALFILDKRLVLFALPMVPILIVWIAVYRRIAGRYNKVIRSKVSDINGMINEAISGMPIIQAFRREKKTEQEFEAHNRELYEYQTKMLNLNSITSHNLVNFLRNTIFLLVIWLFWGGTLGTFVSVGVLYAFVDYMNRMFQPIVGIVNQLTNLETARISAERVFQVLDEKGDDVAEGTIPRYKGSVAFEHVFFAYQEREWVLRDISFQACQGETVALVGHTGSGKSSIMNLLFRFYDVEEGRITIDGQDIRSIPRQHLRAHMGIVLQDPFLFTGTIATNVSLNDPAISRERVEQALRAVGAYEMFLKLPGGIDAPVIEKGSTLSSGQRQLISFARALAFDPAILILDEATASIDTETESLIQQALDVLKKGRTTFVIAHRLSTIRQADQILVLDHGRIVERGTHEQLMEAGGKYYGMYQLQLGSAAAAGIS
ncbi:MAG: multidrug transporter permease [Paenibacillaceae bacterium]|nr:multidrug transporter permease [Paenibacillaceae bacterium]